ncbi:MAG: hypothetical protein EON54_24975, partial [Alcaligenaceae bacterium]
MALVNDTDIDRLIGMHKTVMNPKARNTEQRGSRRKTFDLEGPQSERFQMYVRENLRIPDGYSCGLLFLHPSGEKVTLTRYNGSDHEHSNPLDSGAPIPFQCHIHRATERYIEAGRKAEHYAETTDRYSDFAGALRSFIQD